MIVRVTGRRFPVLLAALLLIVAPLVSMLSAEDVYAAQITPRKLTLQAGTDGPDADTIPDGGSQPGGNSVHFYEITIPGGSVGSIKFEYCTTASGTCTMPTGLVTTSATLSAQTGTSATGFTMVNTTNGSPYITRTAATISANTAASYTLSNVTNPTATNTSFFVRIATYTATNATGSPIDSGTVTASTATQIVLTGTMPESIIFCTGATISVNGGGIPDCTTAGTGAITFNQLFSTTDTATATSQMAASTNGTTGYVITVSGPTMTSGSNTITAMGTAATGARGTPQFGMNLKLNTTATSTPAVGLEVAQPANGTSLRGQATTGYNTADTFKFTSGDTVANSANGGAGPTNAQIFTSSYIVNVPGNQPAGQYTTTLTYVCTATF